MFVSGGGMSKETGGPAFPHWDEDQGCWHIGLTARDYFAAKALQSIILMDQRQCWPFDIDPSENDDDTECGRASVCAYVIADAMLAERDK